MVTIKEMPVKEKYDSACSYFMLMESWVQALVRENLGDEKATNLRNAWEKLREPTPEGSSFEEKYETVYRNWMREWQKAYELVYAKFGEVTDEKFAQAEAKALKQKSAGASLYMFKLMRAIAPKTAFQTFGKQMAYQWQVFTPSTVTELNSERLVLAVQNCKTLSVEGCEAPCLVGCMKAGPLWMKDTFNLNLTLDRKARNCTMTVTR